MVGHKRTVAGDPVRVAKIAGLFAIGAAMIGAIPTSISLLSHETVDSKPPPPTIAATPTPTATSLSNGAPDTGLRFSPVNNGKLTVSGSAQKDVIGMYVVIGPKSSSGGYDTGCGNVVNQHWQAEVATDESWPKYPLVTIPAFSSCVGAASEARESVFKFTFQGTGPTTSPPPPPDRILHCAKQNGPSCFKGPGFGPPTTFQPNH
jgi:hypothetical protein